MVKSMIYAQAKLLAALSGKSEDTIWRDANALGWRKVARAGCKGMFFCIADLERDYQLHFTQDQVAAANETYSLPAAISVEEHVHVE